MSAAQTNRRTVRQNSFWRTVRAVGWSFLGVRKNSGFQEDGAQISPFQVILIGIVGVLLFVISLIALVNWVVAK
jgi:hypothetical protein